MSIMDSILEREEQERCELRNRIYDLNMNGTREDIPELVDLESKLREIDR